MFQGGFMKSFFGIGGYSVTPEGAYSWQHLLFVAISISLMIGLAIFIALMNKNKSEKDKNRVLIVCAILIDAVEIFKIVLFSIRDNDPTVWTRTLPLFLCSIQLITIPIAAFSKGRLREAALDFVFIFGLLSAVAGTIGAAQNYNAYPVLSFPNVVSAITHCISGFCSLYIVIAKMQSMKKKNIWITYSILLSFMAAAFVANKIIPYNYMFLESDDGTPFVLFANLVNHNKILYPITVVLSLVLYVAVFYLVYYAITGRKNKSIQSKQ